MAYKLLDSDAKFCRKRSTLNGPLSNSYAFDFTGKIAKKIFSWFRRLWGSIDRIFALWTFGNAPDGPSKSSVKSMNHPNKSTH
jgi:hypothetical protein